MLKTQTLFPDADDELSEYRQKNDAGESVAGTETKQRTALEPKPYHNKTLPSRAAAESARSFVRSQAVRVSEYIASAGEHGCTDKQIQTALAMDGNSQRPRRVWLRDHGFIQAKGEPEDIVMRDGATVWVSVRPFEVVTTRTPANAIKSG